MPDRMRTQSEGSDERQTNSPSSPFSRYSPIMARKSFGKLGRTLRYLKLYFLKKIFVDLY